MKGLIQGDKFSNRFHNGIHNALKVHGTEIEVGQYYKNLSKFDNGLVEDTILLRQNSNLAVMDHVQPEQEEFF